MGQTTVRDIMTSSVVTLMEADNLGTIAADFDTFRFRHLPVVDGKRLVGIISERDMWRAHVSELDGSRAAQARSNRLDDTFVAAVMHRDPITISPDEPVSHAAAKMVETRIGALPVVDEAGDLLGIITEYDLLRELAKD